MVVVDAGHRRVLVFMSCDFGMLTARWAQSNAQLLIRSDRGFFKMDENLVIELRVDATSRVARFLCKYRSRIYEKALYVSGATQHKLRNNGVKNEELLIRSDSTSYEI